MPWSRGEQGDAGFFGETAPAVGHVHGGGFVACVDEVDVTADGGVVDREDLIARE